MYIFLVSNTTIFISDKFKKRKKKGGKRKNRSAIAVVHNPIQLDHVKHVGIKRNFIKPKIEIGKISMSYVPYKKIIFQPNH